MRIPRRIALALRRDPLLERLRREAERTGAEVFLVGGYLRDRFLRRPVRDCDFVLAGVRRPFLARVRRMAAGGVTLRRGGVTNHRFRIDGRACDFVEVPGSRGVRAELRRRDFTVNALACNLRTGAILDPCGGLRDLARGRVRAATPGALAADPLRILRGVRIACERPSFTLARETRRRMRAARRGIRTVAAERIRDEFDRILLSGAAERGLRDLLALEALFPTLPELEPLAGAHQAGGLSVLEHTLRVVGRAERRSRLGPYFAFSGTPAPEDLLVLLYAALFHDSGKPATFARERDGTIHFHGHETISREIAAGFLRRWRFPLARAARIERLVLNHLRVGWLAAGDPSDRALRRVIRDLENDLPLLLLHSLADRRSSAPRGRREDRRHRATGRALYRMFRRRGRAILRPPRLVDGHDVMRVLRIGPGPAVGDILRDIRERHEEGAISTRKEALRYLRTLRKETIRTRIS
ncbi:MAG: HD domain-containing protein [Acidobacteria bacterium]|nr:HD domain-containing protein [Acidobacteriota bacterium]